MQRGSFYSDRKFTACFLLGWDQLLAEGNQSLQEAGAGEVSAYLAYMGELGERKGKILAAVIKVRDLNCLL